MKPVILGVPLPFIQRIVLLLTLPILLLLFQLLLRVKLHPFLSLLRVNLQPIT